jgi:hypothetical protein
MGGCWREWAKEKRGSETRGGANKNVEVWKITMFNFRKYRKFSAIISECP